MQQNGFSFCICSSTVLQKPLCLLAKKLLLSKCKLNLHYHASCYSTRNHMGASVYILQSRRNEGEQSPVAAVQFRQSIIFCDLKTKRKILFRRGCILHKCMFSIICTAAVKLRFGTISTQKSIIPTICHAYGITTKSLLILLL